MTGIKYIVNESGDKTAVVIDLKLNKQIWEDFHDILVADKRKNEQRVSFNQVKKNLAKKIKLNG